MAERLVSDSQEAADLRMILESVKDATGTSEGATSAETNIAAANQAATDKKNQPGMLRRAAGAVAGAGKLLVPPDQSILGPPKPSQSYGGVEAVQSVSRAAMTGAKAAAGAFVSGGKNIADALLPPGGGKGLLGAAAEGQVTDPTQTAKDLGQAAYGGMESTIGAVFGGLQEAARSAGIDLSTLATGRDAEVPLPEGLKATYQMALKAMEAPSLLDPKVRATRAAETPEDTAKRRQREENPTVGDLTAFAAGLLPFGTVGKIRGRGAADVAPAPGVRAPKPGTRAAAEAAAEAEFNKATAPPVRKFEPTDAYAQEQAARRQFESQRAQERAPVEAAEGQPATDAKGAPVAADVSVITAAKGLPEDAANMTALKADLEARGIQVEDVTGRYGGADEAGYRVTGASLKDLQELGEKYNQESVIHDGELHYTTGESKGMVRQPSGEMAFDEAATDNFSVGPDGKKYSIPYDWDAAPISQGEGAAKKLGIEYRGERGGMGLHEFFDPTTQGDVAVRDMADLPARLTESRADFAAADAAKATKAADEAAAPVPIEAEAVTPDPVAAEPVAPPAPPATIADVQTAVQPVAEAAAVEVKTIVQERVATAAQERLVREEANAVAQQMRAQGASRREINEVYRAKLNEAGIKSKNQKKADAYVEQQLGNTDSAPRDRMAEQLQASIDHIKGRIKELTGEAGVIIPGAITEGMKKNSETWNHLKAGGAAVLHYGARDFESFSRAMIETFGADVAPHLKELYPLSQTQLDKFIQKTRTERGLPSLEELRESVKRGEPGFEWYDKAPDELRDRFGPNADTFAGTYAASSPLQDAAITNMDLAWTAYNHILTGRRDGVKKLFTPKKDGIMPIVADNLNRVARGERVSGPKIHPFEGLLRQDAYTSGARNVGVYDTWMGRLYGFMRDKPGGRGDSAGSISPAQRTFMQVMTEKMAADLGADVVQIQAAQWTDIKASVERGRVLNRAMDADGNFRKGWDADKISAELGGINEAMGTPFDRLLMNRLGPQLEAIRQGDVTMNGDALIARKASAAVLENAADPITGIKVELQKLGMETDYATAIAEQTVDGMRQAGMDDGAGGINLGHVEGAPRAPFDRRAAEGVISERLKGLCP